MNEWIVPGAVTGSTDFNNYDEGDVSLIQINTAAEADAAAELERFTGASSWLLKKESRLELTEQQEHANNTLFNMAMSTRNKEMKDDLLTNRRTVLEANEDEGSEIDKLIADQQSDMDEDEQYDRSFRKSQAERGYELVEWLKANTPSASRDMLIKWSKQTNARRINPDFPENRLSYCHWVASKIVLEYWLSRRCTGQYKVKAAVNHAKALENWETHDLQARYDAHLHESIGFNEIDMDASYMGRCGIAASRMEEYIDVARDKDEDLLKGFLLFREKNGMQLPKGTEAKSFANILITLSRCNGNKTAAAKLLGVARSTYCGWVAQAEKKLVEMATPVSEAIAEGLIHNR